MRRRVRETVMMISKCRVLKKLVLKKLVLKKVFKLTRQDDSDDFFIGE